MTLSKFEKLIKNWEIVLITVFILCNNNFSEKRSVKMFQIGVLPHWNVSYFDVLHDQMHCWMLLHSREIHKYMVFHPCGIVNVFLSFQVGSKLCCNFRTESIIGNMNISNNNKHWVIDFDLLKSIPIIIFIFLPYIDEVFHQYAFSYVQLTYIEP